MKNYHNLLIDAKPQEFGEYSVALAKYKDACKRFALIRKKYKYSTDSRERLVYYEARDIYGAACREYNIARSKWERAVIEFRLQKDYLDNPAVIAKILDIKTPLGLADIIKEHDKKRIAESFGSDVEFEKAKAIIMQGHEKYIASRESTRESFVEKDDPTVGDFEPLP